MTPRSTTLCRRTLLTLSVALFALAATVRADDAPTFSDPDVNAYVKSYADFTDHYAADMKDYMAAAKSGDTTKMQAAAAKMQPDQAKAQDLATKSAGLSGKLKPDETAKFSAYLQKCAQKMTDAAKQ